MKTKTKPIPTIWKDGEVRIYANSSTGRKIEARCIDKEEFKILRLDRHKILFHTTSCGEFRSYLRGELREYNLKLTSQRKGIYKPIMR